ncbi:MAG: hypothetical protein HY332_02145 [Chloroflexi bacterium]|nr:hypothetical protein [Chloroflexota bacterium]
MTTGLLAAPIVALGVDVAPDGTQVALIYLPVGEQGQFGRVAGELAEPEAARRHPDRD